MSPPSSLQGPGGKLCLLYHEDVQQLADQLSSSSSSSHHPRSKKPTRLVVIDFDNTLFRSPVPSRRLWHSSLIGRLKSPELGWYHHPLTLQEPYVQCGHGDASWFNTPILREARQAIQDPHSLTLLLTGRSRSVYQDRILQLLHTQNLHFDLVLLREYHPDLPNTLAFKIQVLWDILHAIPSLHSMILWEDRPTQAQAFKEKLHLWMKGPGVEWRGRDPLRMGKVVLLSRPSIRYLPAYLERDLVKALLRDHARRAEPGIEALNLCFIPTDAFLILPKTLRFDLLFDLLPSGPWTRVTHHRTGGQETAITTSVYPSGQSARGKGNPPITQEVLPFPFPFLQSSWRVMHQGRPISLSISAVGWKGSEAWIWCYLPEWHMAWRHPLAKRPSSSSPIPSEVHTGHVKVSLKGFQGPIQCRTKATFVRGYEGWSPSASPPSEVHLGQMIKKYNLPDSEYRAACQRALQALHHHQIPLIPPYLPDISQVVDRLFASSSPSP